MKKHTTIRIFLIAAVLAVAAALTVCLASCSDPADTSVVSTDADSGTTTSAPDEPATDAPATSPAETTAPESVTTAPDDPDDDIIIPDSGKWSNSIAQAKSLENLVYTQYLDEARERWLMKNQNMSLVYDRRDLHAFEYISNPDGVPYVSNTGYTYIVNGDGKLMTSTYSKAQTMTNTYEMGYYYYQTHVQGERFGSKSTTGDLYAMKQDRTLHLYSNKFNLEQHLVAADDALGLSGYGQYFDIDMERVNALVVKDAAGLHETIEGVDWNTAEYVAFDIENAGIFGYILVPYENEGKLTVTVTDGMYRVDQSFTYDATVAIPKQTHIYFGCRIYTDATHSFDAFLHEAKVERHPLSNDHIVILSDTPDSYTIGYDALRGSYSVFVDGQGLENSWCQYFASHIKVFNDEYDRQIFLTTYNGIGTIENAVVLDEDGQVLPISPEVCKNFSGDGGFDAVYDPGDPGFSYAYIPLTMSAGESFEFTMINLSDMWGSFKLKQLSSIGFWAPYYHLSLGVIETNCITPDGCLGKDYWFLPDYRALTGYTWGGGFQCDSIGKHFLMMYEDENGTMAAIEKNNEDIDSSGPIYADITYSYTTGDGRADISYRHVELPQEDENRTYYTMRMDVNEAISFTDFRNDFSIYSFDGRFFHFGKSSYLDENNEIVHLEHKAQKPHDVGYTLGTEAPFMTAWSINWNNDNESENSTAPNHAFIIKDWDIVIGGEQYTGNFYVRDHSPSGTISYGKLSLDLGEVTLQPGDHIYVNIILLPWGGNFSEDISNVLNVREDSVFNPYKLTATTGTVIRDTYVPKIMAQDGTAEFTITGGDNIAAIRVYGLSSYRRPTIQEKINGEWVDYDTTGSDYPKYVCENDGYFVYYEGDGTYSAAFAVDMTDAGTEGRTFRVIEAE